VAARSGSILTPRQTSVVHPSKVYARAVTKTRGKGVDRRRARAGLPAGRLQQVRVVGRAPGLVRRQVRGRARFGLISKRDDDLPVLLRLNRCDHVHPSEVREDIPDLRRVRAVPLFRP